MATIGTVLEAHAPERIETFPDHAYNICTITLPKGLWLLFGYTLSCGNVMFTRGNLFAGRSTSATHSSNIALGLLKVYDESMETTLYLELPSVYEDFKTGTIHSDPNYCGIKAIKVG